MSWSDAQYRHLARNLVHICCSLVPQLRSAVEIQFQQEMNRSLIFDLASKNSSIPTFTFIYDYPSAFGFF
jgi:hypothetical protein